MRALRVLLAFGTIGVVVACGSAFHSEDGAESDAGDAAPNVVSDATFADGETPRDGTTSEPLDASSDATGGDDDGSPGNDREGGSPIVGLIAANYFSCALRANGVVACWGDGTFGELGTPTMNIGDGGATSIATPTVIKTFPATPVAISGALFTGCALLADGTVACWGTNGYGQLGVNAGVQSSPTPLRIPGIANALDVATGFFLSCARMNTADGGAVQTVCWGEGVGNDTGAFDAGMFDAGNQPLQPVLPVRNLPSASQVSAYDGLSCAVVDGGAVDCWGNDALVSRVTLSDGGAFNDVTEVSTGASFACALRRDGSVWCWGDNQFAELGLASTAAVPKPTQPTITGAVAVSAGFAHACAILDGGELDCWGLDNLHQVAGDVQNAVACNGSICVETPTKKTIGSGASVARVVAGATTTMVVTKKNELFEWGANEYDELGYVTPDGGQTCTVVANGMVQQQPCSSVATRVPLP